MKGNKLPIIEIFGPTIQGEGSLIGVRTHFIRFGGCGYRCTWCDSMHAVDPVQIKKNVKWMLDHEIATAIEALPPSKWITLSGGDPAMRGKEMIDLIDHLKHEAGYKLAVETQGQFYQEWLEEMDVVTLSPKPPSSGMDKKIDYSVLRQYYDKCANLVLKVVVFNDEDIAFAQEIHEQFVYTPMYISIGTPVQSTDVRSDILDGMLRTLSRVLHMDSMHDVTVLPQLHALLWGHDKGH